MTLTDKISHAAERKAFETLLDNLIKKGQTQDASQVASDLIAMVQRLHGDVWSEKSFQTLRMIANDPNGKWAHYTQRLLRDNDPYILKTFLTNAVYEGGIRGYHVAQETAAKYDINVPWLILMDPTSACNMHCTGCWAAEYGHKQSLTFEEMDKTLTEAKALGTHACLFTGGEPLMRKKDIIRLCEKHRDIAFHAFTNGTLIDDEFCKEMLRVGNFFVSVSIEGFEEANDGRRGDGHFQRALAAMDRMRSYRIPFGVSICYTSRNYQVVTSDEFLDLLISKGCVFAWYFHYMPVGQNADTSLLLTPEQRIYTEKPRARDPRGHRRKRALLHRFPERRRVCRRLRGWRQDLLPHQRRGRRGALRLHSLLERQHQGAVLPRVPPAAAVQALPQGAAVQRQSSAPVSDARKSGAAAKDGSRVRRAFHRPGSPGDCRAPVRKVQGLRGMLEADGRSALAG